MLKLLEGTDEHIAAWAANALVATADLDFLKQHQAEIGKHAMDEYKAALEELLSHFPG